MRTSHHIESCLVWSSHHYFWPVEGASAAPTAFHSLGSLFGKREPNLGLNRFSEEDEHEDWRKQNKLVQWQCNNMVIEVVGLRWSTWCENNHNWNRWQIFYHKGWMELWTRRNYTDKAVTIQMLNKFGTKPNMTYQKLQSQHTRTSPYRPSTSL